jgi:hypothetical protein
MKTTLLVLLLAVGGCAHAEPLRVVVLSDLNSSYGSTEYDPEVGHAVRRTVDEWRPDLVLIAGDMIAGQRPALEDANVRAMWAAFDSVVAAPLRRAGIPLAVTMGNHDGSAHPGHERDRRLAAEYWGTRQADILILDGGRYPFYYAFTRGDVFFLVLDASTGAVVADTAQMAWLATALASREARSAGLRVSMGHVPLYAVAEGRDRPGEVQAHPDSLRSIMETAGVRLHISGHHHAYYPGRVGALDLLHAGALGQGPRTLLGSDLPPARTVTILDLYPARDSLAERTFRVYDDVVDPLDVSTLPRRIDGINGPVILRDTHKCDTEVTEMSEVSEDTVCSQCPLRILRPHRALRVTVCEGSRTLTAGTCTRYRPAAVNPFKRDQGNASNETPHEVGGRLCVCGIHGGCYGRRRPGAGRAAAAPAGDLGESVRSAARIVQRRVRAGYRTDLYRRGRRLVLCSQ